MGKEPFKHSNVLGKLQGENIHMPLFEDTLSIHSASDSGMKLNKLIKVGFL